MPRRIAYNIAGFNNNYIGEDIQLCVEALVKSKAAVVVREPNMDISFNSLLPCTSAIDTFASRNVRMVTNAVSVATLEAKNTRPIELSEVGTTNCVVTPYTIPTLSEAYNSSMRQITAKIELYLDGDESTPIVLDRHTMTSFEILEEAKADSSSPLGSISSNELVVSLVNINDMFNPNNTESIYYGKLLPLVKIKPYVGIYTYNETHKDGYILWESLGTYYTGDWLPTYSSLDVNLTCYDRFYFEGGLSLIGFKGVTKTTLEIYLNSMFNYLGIDLPVIDEALRSVNIDVAGFVGDTFAETLAEIAKATGCFIYIDRYNKYVFKVPFVTTDFHHIVSDSKQILNISAPVKYLDAYSSVILGINKPKLVADVELFSESNVNSVDEYFKQHVKLTDGHAVDATISVVDKENLPVEGITASVELVDPYRANIHVIGNLTDASIKIVGSKYDPSVYELNYINNTMYTMVGENVINLSSDLLQDEAHAKSYLFQLYNQLCNPRQRMTVTLRGIPSIILSEKAHVIDTASKIDEKMFVYRNMIRYDGGLEHTIEGLRYASENVDPIASSGLKNKFNRSPFNRLGTTLGGV